MDPTLDQLRSNHLSWISLEVEGSPIHLPCEAMTGILIKEQPALHEL